jgi:hypothetical protein
MKYFIVTFRQEDSKPIVNKITGYYSDKELFNAIEQFHRDEILFSIYSAECVCDLS